MKSQVTLLLVCMLFSEALSLSCHECIPTGTGPCVMSERNCPDQCLTATLSTEVVSVMVTDVSMKTCSSAEMCTSGSLNLGLVKISSNGKCCSTPLCNSETLPALSKQDLNGKVCYGCDENGCSAKVSCLGNEDHCISASVQQGTNTVSMKGCVSKNFCAGSGSSSTQGIGISKVHCCVGNLCNTAESFTLSFLLMMAPLLSSFLF